MESFVTVVILLAIITAAVCYVIKSKKSGKKCIGCPNSCNCCKSNSDGGCSGCKN